MSLKLRSRYGSQGIKYSDFGKSTLDFGAGHVDGWFTRAFAILTRGIGKIMKSVRIVILRPNLGLSALRSAEFQGLLSWRKRPPTWKSYLEVSRGNQMSDLMDTGNVREKMLALWKKLDQGKITHTEARVHIGFARTVLDTIKVEIAAAHLQDAELPKVPLASKRMKTIQAPRTN